MNPDLQRILAASTLLGRASRLIRANAASLIECHSNLVSLERDGEPAEHVPAPGSIEPDSLPLIGQLIDLLRDIDAWVGQPLELGPPWLDDLLARRNGWEDGI